MAYFDLYKEFVTANGTSLSEQHSNTIQAFIEENFEDSPTCQIVRHNNEDVVVRVTTIGFSYQYAVYNKILRNILFRDLNYIVGIGDYIQFDEASWLCITVKKTSVVNTCIVAKCNNTLRFNDAQTLISVPCIVSDGGKFLYDENNIMGKPDSQIYVMVGANTDSNKIKINQRFFLNDTVYIVTNIDDIAQEGIISIGFRRDVVTQADDRTTGVADATTPTGGTGLW